MDNFSDYIVFADESGDATLKNVDQDFPLFVLTFIIIKKTDYSNLENGFSNIKLKYFGHTEVVFHERDIRKAILDFSILLNASVRSRFMEDITDFIKQLQFNTISIVIKKEEYKNDLNKNTDPYHFAMQLGLERVERHLRGREPISKLVHFVFESRGAHLDHELEEEFRRVCEGKNCNSLNLNYKSLLISKLSNSAGLQLADLIGRPIGRHVINRDQKNRSFEVIREKLDRNPDDGSVEGYGLTCYP